MPYSDFSETNNALAYLWYGDITSGDFWNVSFPGGYSWEAPSYKNQGGFTLYPGTKFRFERLCADPYDIARLAADPRNVMKISEEYSEGELLAVEILNQKVIPAVWEDAFDIIDLTVATPEKAGEIEISGNTGLWFESGTCEIREMPDGKSYLMITEEQWRSMSTKASTVDAEKLRLEFFARNY